MKKGWCVMTDNPLASIEECFGNINDPRVKGRCEYRLQEILIIAICAAVAGADTWTDVETFGKSRVEWLKQFIVLEKGIPSHDTFGDVFRMIDADEFQRSFMRWVEGVFTLDFRQLLVKKVRSKGAFFRRLAA